MAAIDPTERTVDELREDIDDVDAADELREILAAEADGDDRKSAKEAIERRVEGIENGQDENESNEPTGADESDGDGDTTGDGGDDESTTENDGTDGTDGAHNGSEGTGGTTLIDVRNRVRDTAADLIGRRLDGVSGIQRTDQGWSVIVNVIERRSVPDTQDILGRYEISLDSSGEIGGFRRLSRYRRSDTIEEDWQ